MKRSLGALPLLLSVTNLLAQSATPENSATEAAQVAGTCFACGTGVIVLGVLHIVLAIALVVWVARDSKNRGMDNSFMWMILVFFTSLLGFIIYIFSRSQGKLVECPSCKNKRLEASAKCPHCGQP
jgi:uncharacterized membrane protein